MLGVKSDLLEDLQQDLKDLLTTTEYEDDRVHGDTETD
jgi:hypothetical protein